MRRKSNLELCLFPTYNSSQNHPNTVKDKDESDHHQIQSPIQNYFHQQQQQQHPLTIFYDGKICATDVTELQAKSILMLANTQMQEKVKRTNGSSEPCTPTTMVQSPHQLYSPGSDTGLSMKRSLQRFLQKRKSQVQQASPYQAK